MFEVITDAKTGKQTIRPYTASEIAALQPSVEKLAADVRTMRNKLLSDSDWTQVLDAPVDQVLWATYRQALRDVTQQEGFPQNVVWPVAP